MLKYIPQFGHSHVLPASILAMPYIRAKFNKTPAAVNRITSRHCNPITEVITAITAAKTPKYIITFIFVFVITCRLGCQDLLPCVPGVVMTCPILPHHPETPRNRLIIVHALRFERRDPQMALDPRLQPRNRLVIAHALRIERRDPLLALYPRLQPRNRLVIAHAFRIERRELFP